MWYDYQKRFLKDEPSSRPLSDINDPTWSVIISLVILLAGVFYVIVYIIGMANNELNDVDLTNKSEQDSKLAVLESKIESYRERIIEDAEKKQKNFVTVFVLRWFTNVLIEQGLQVAGSRQ